MKSLLRVLLMIGLLLIGSQSAGRAAAEESEPSWSLGLGMGFASSYKYGTQHFTFGDRDQKFEEGMIHSFSVNRGLGHRRSIQTSLDYFAQEDRGRALSLQIGAMGIGVRQSFAREQTPHLYFELLPALFIGKWTDDLTDYSLTSARPGIIGGLGIQGPLAERIHIDVGVRGLLSTGWPEVGHLRGEPDYFGIERAVLGARLVYGI